MNPRIANLILVFAFPFSVTTWAGSTPLFFTPSGPVIAEVENAIQGAQTSVHMEMYHLTQTSVIHSLIAAKNRGVDVQVILDQQQVSYEKTYGAWHSLTAAGVAVTQSSAGPTGFNITHTKAFVIDGQTAYIMTMNLTKIADSTRDVGLITTDAPVVQFFETLFQADLKNAADKTALSPATIPDNIVLAPLNARPKLEALLKEAKQSIQLEVENFSDAALLADLISAQAQGVAVQVLMPRCDLGNADFDMAAARQLNRAGVQVRMMPTPSTNLVPYIHQKSIVVDGHRAFLGSENFSYNSLDHSRELGIIIDDGAQINQLASTFVNDFNKGLALADAEAATCAKHDLVEDERTIEPF